jgi:hypothetical protein
VEGDVFVKVDDVVEGGLTEERDETATDGYMLAAGICGWGRLRKRIRATSTWRVNAAARAMG